MLWGGRFKKELDPAAMRFSSSFGTDYRLLEVDIEGSQAHAEMLHKIGILSGAELKQIHDGLNLIVAKWHDGSWQPKPDDFEDVHSAVEQRLTELIGSVAGKLHTGRSRNDQIATDEKLWIKKACASLKKNQSALQKSLLAISEQHVYTLMPGYTHMQRAQPISVAFHLLAYVEMLERDKMRLDHVMQLADESPLGSGAMAGSTLPLDRDMTSRSLRFSKPTSNALDSVSDRDFFMDLLHACVVGMIHLSRLSEEIILWSSAEWHFVKLSDAWSTGSSMMPQKKNPDMAELIRGKTGRVFGAYIALSSTLKGLPLSYNRDLQEDKDAVFDAYDTYHDSLPIMSEMIGSMEIDAGRFSDELEGDFSLATDLADKLVIKGEPFRNAHRIIGEVVQFAEKFSKKLNEISLKELQSIYPGFESGDLELLSIRNVLERKQTYGSPNPELVRAQIERWKLSIL
jgi:argininosuccinate lyase